MTIGKEAPAVREALATSGDDGVRVEIISSRASHEAILCGPAPREGNSNRRLANTQCSSLIHLPSLEVHLRSVRTRLVAKGATYELLWLSVERLSLRSEVAQ